MSLLIELVVSVLKMLAELWIVQAKEPSHDTAVDADRDPALRARLERRVRESGTRASDSNPIG
jgi:hypothetical protein